MQLKLINNQIKNAILQKIDDLRYVYSMQNFPLMIRYIRTKSA